VVAIVVAVVVVAMVAVMAVVIVVVIAVAITGFAQSRPDAGRRSVPCITQFLKCTRSALTVCACGTGLAFNKPVPKLLPGQPGAPIMCREGWR